MKKFLLLTLLSISLIAQSVTSDLYTFPSEPSQSANNSYNVKNEIDKLKKEFSDSIKNLKGSIAAIKIIKSDTVQQTPSDFDLQLWNENKSTYDFLLVLSLGIICLWLIVAIVLIIIVYRRYNVFCGFCKKKYYKIIKSIENDDTIPIHERAKHYPCNPYRDETLGLPRGTIRGFLTITLLVGNLLLLWISFYAPPTTLFSNRVEFITSAFLMMIAFYFGSRAVDVFKSREQTRREENISPKTDSHPVRVSAPPEEITPLTSLEKDEETYKPTSDNIPKKEDSEKLNLEKNIVALTSYFETSKKFKDACKSVTGNFDGMGISFGCLQWNFGQDSLQPLLNQFFHYGSEKWKEDKNLVHLSEVIKKPHSFVMDWSKSIQTQKNNRYIIDEEWQKSLSLLGELSIPFQIAACAPRFNVAKSWCKELQLFSERALALMFDISVQNGILFRKIDNRKINVRRSINERFSKLENPTEENKLIIIAEERSKASNPRWIKDVLARKLCIAKGEGNVHGVNINLNSF